MTPRWIGFCILSLVAWWGASGSTAHAEEKVFFGNLHSHTSFSDGSGTPEEAYRQAKHVARLDFLAITEHNHKSAESSAGERRDGILIATNPRLYKGPGADALIPTAQRWTLNGSFVALYGQEFSSIGKGNHVNVIDVGEVISSDNGDFGDLLSSWLETNRDSSGQRALVQLNHPALLDDDGIEYGRDDFDSDAAWIQSLDRDAQLIEILNGPAMTRGSGNRAAEVMEKDYLEYLNLGFHLAPTANQDNHYFTWGTATDARTAVIADELTKPKLIVALKARHVYATEDKNLHIIIKVNSHLCGDVVLPPSVDQELDITYSIKDLDEPDAGYEISVYSDVPDGDVAHSIESIRVRPDASGVCAGKIEDIRFTANGQYVFFKIVQSDEDGREDRAWTAPVWFEPSGTTSPANLSGDDSQCVASRNSSVYHVNGECQDAKRIKAENRITGPDAKRGRRQHEGCPR